MGPVAGRPFGLAGGGSVWRAAGTTDSVVFASEALILGP